MKKLQKLVLVMERQRHDEAPQHLYSPPRTHDCYQKPVHWSLRDPRQETERKSKPTDSGMEMRQSISPYAESQSI